MILDASLPPGRINEVHLAAQLGVSRTPVREALMRLVSEGAVTSIPRHGFYVRPLTVEELEQLYPLRSFLDPAALRLAGIPTAERLTSLRSINRKLRDARTAAEAVRLDDKWHFELIEQCENPILLGFIEQVIWRTRRYELALMQQRPNVARAAAEHELILDALEAGDLDRACSVLTDNMRAGKESILEWLRAQEEIE